MAGDTGEAQQFPAQAQRLPPTHTPAAAPLAGATEKEAVGLVPGESAARECVCMSLENKPEGSN